MRCPLPTLGIIEWLRNGRNVLRLPLPGHGESYSSHHSSGGFGMAKKEKQVEKPETDDETSEGEAKSGGMMGLIALVFAAVAGSFGANYLLAPSTPAGSNTAEATCAADEKKVAEPKQRSEEGQEFVKLEEFLITIGSAPATRYLKMQVAIVTDEEAAKKVKEAEPILVDAFINYLRSVEISDFEDPGFYANMRQQLSRRSELVVGAAASDGVLITEFLLR